MTVTEKNLTMHSLTTNGDLCDPSQRASRPQNHLADNVNYDIDSTSYSSVPTTTDSRHSAQSSCPSSPEGRSYNDITLTGMSFKCLMRAPHLC